MKVNTKGTEDTTITKGIPEGAGKTARVVSRFRYPARAVFFVNSVSVVSSVFA